MKKTILFGLSALAASYASFSPAPAKADENYSHYYICVLLREAISEKDAECSTYSPPTGPQSQQCLEELNELLASFNDLQCASIL